MSGFSKKREAMFEQYRTKLSEFLDSKITIPYNQRNYSWNKEAVEKYLDDIITYYNSNIYGELGQFITLDYNGEISIWDGQQRLLTILIVIKVLSELYEEKQQNLFNRLCIDELELEDDQEKQALYSNSNVIPKIHCVDVNDRNALINIMNDRVIILNEIIKADSYTSPFTNEEYSSKAKFEKHVKSITKLSKLYEAYEIVYNFLNRQIEKSNDKKYFIKDFTKFLLKDTFINTLKCKDPEHTSKLFEQYNNRGVAVSTIDIIKNLILKRISEEDKKIEIYQKFENYRKREIPNWGKNKTGESLFPLAAQLMNNYINREVNLVECFNEAVLKDKDTYNKMNELFSVIDKLIEYLEQIRSDRFGRLLFHTDLKLSKEAFEWGFLPIAFKNGHIDSELIRLLIDFSIRNYSLKLKTTINSLVYSNKFIDICNKVLMSPNYKYLEEFKEHLDENKNDISSPENFRNCLQTRVYTKNNEAKPILMYLETIVSTYEHIPSSSLTVEHIVPQNSNEIEDSTIKLLGNLTLFEGKNTESCNHKGNYSLRDKEYKEKRISFESSSCYLARDIAKEYSNFGESEIDNRTEKLVCKLEESCRYFTTVDTH